MDNHILTTPITITKTYNITNYDYHVTRLNLGKSVHILVIFKDENGIFQREQSVNIMGEDYEKWGLDDNYIHEYIEQNHIKLI